MVDYGGGRGVEKGPKIYYVICERSLKLFIETQVPRSQTRNETYRRLLNRKTNGMTSKYR